jgi:hypothetical protein
MHAGHGGGPLGIPMSREASGTAWQPDATPHGGLHASAGNWTFMFHSRLYAGYDVQDSPRGGREVVALGWLMGMATHQTADGRFTARLMLSPEALTATGKNGGYPLLLQSGEAANGVPLHDVQHPHDFWMEIALSHLQKLGPELALQLYGALSGEPALGPVAFPHRYSAMADPMAVLGHHWQDSTHVSFGVATVGLVTRFAKLEMSAFNGREPDEHRYNLELRTLDSFAVRLSANPLPSVSAQVSYGYLASPDGLHPEISLERVTASVSVLRDFGNDRRWATTFVVGRNVEGGHHSTHAFLLESQFELDAHNVFFARGEIVQKAGHDLGLDDAALEDVPFPVGGVVLGYVRNFGHFGEVTPGVGVRFAINAVPDELLPYYGSGSPVGGMLFFRLLIGQ